MKSTTPCDGNNILLPLSIINDDKIVTVVLLNKIFQRKQASLFWILEMQNNKIQMPNEMERMTELERFIAPLRFFKLCKNQSFEKL